MFRRSGYACIAVGLAIVGLGVGPEDGAAKLVGSWSWTWKDAAGVTHKHVLEVEGTGEKLSARERFDDEEPVKVTDLKVMEKKVSFSVNRDKRQATYSGTLKAADLIEGLVNVSTGGQANEFSWEARREAAKKK